MKELRTKKKRNLIRMAGMLICFLVLCGCISGSALSAQAAKKVQNGWDASKQHYYENGVMVTGKKKIEGHWYYFNKLGKIQKEKFIQFKKQNKICYYDENGWAATGSKKIGKYWYYFNKKNCAMVVSDFVTIASKNRTCYYNKNGRRVKGFKKIGNAYYLFDSKTGAMRKGFQTFTRNGQQITCYFNKKGRMVTGEKLIKGTLYSFDKLTGNVESMLIAHASGDERGEYYYGRAGDQTGTEVCIRSWYNRPWNCVLRAKSASMREKIALAMERAAANNNIGYDMDERNTLYYYVKDSGYDPGVVAKVCETDCSALVSVACMYAGIPANLLFQEGNSSVTWNLRSRLESTGKFKTYTSNAYIAGTSKLIRGDILLYEGHHTAVVTGRKQF